MRTLYMCGWTGINGAWSRGLAATGTRKIGHVVFPAVLKSGNPVQHPVLDFGLLLARMSHKFEKRCEARQSEISAGSVLAHVTKRIVAITLPRALVVLRFLLNSIEETDCSWPNPTTLCYLTNYIRSAETGEIFGLGTPPFPSSGV